MLWCKFHNCLGNVQAVGRLAGTGHRTESMVVMSWLKIIPFMWRSVCAKHTLST